LIPWSVYRSPGARAAAAVLLVLLAPPAWSEDMAATAAPAKAEPEPVPVPIAVKPSPNPGESALVIMGVPIRFSASITVRWDYSKFANQTDLYEEDQWANGMRTRVRMGLDFGDDKTPVVGGVRLALGENPNPTLSFTPLGTGLTAKSIGADMFWGAYRPFANRDLIGLTVGKMPNPNWRGDGVAGVVKDELIWDDDVNPEGANLHITFYKSGEKKPKWKVENNLGFYMLNDIPDIRFTGINGITTQVAEQLHVTIPFIGAAVAFYDYKNLNNGLLTPSYMMGESAFNVTGQNAYLLRPGFWLTNNQVNHGPGAAGFASDEFRVLNLLANLHAPLSDFMSQLGDSAEIYALLDYTKNFSVSRDSVGYGTTLGVHFGDWNTNFHPFNAWITWRDVDADATLATFADSDLGAGTDYRGIEVAANYRVARNAMVMVSYFSFMGFPNKDNYWSRLFVDTVLDF
jgi:hypothetical protein